MQNYCLIDEATNICINICWWDGNTEAWSPPDGTFAFPQSTTPSKNWQLIDDQWVLVDSIGEGNIGFIWEDGYLVTNQPEPLPLVQPITEGTQEL